MRACVTLTPSLSLSCPSSLTFSIALARSVSSRFFCHPRYRHSSNRHAKAAKAIVPAPETAPETFQPEAETFHQVEGVIKVGTVTEDAEAEKQFEARPALSASLWFRIPEHSSCTHRSRFTLAL